MEEGRKEVGEEGKAYKQSVSFILARFSRHSHWECARSQVQIVKLELRKKIHLILRQCNSIKFASDGGADGGHWGASKQNLSPPLGASAFDGRRACERASERAKKEAAKKVDGN